MTRKASAGFSMIELMITLAIAVILMVLAVPNYAAWVADGQIRAAAESTAGGMRIAFAEAIKRNQQVEFVLIDCAGGAGGWDVIPVGASAVRSERFVEGSKLVGCPTLPAGATTVTFTSIGTINPTNADASPILEEVNLNFSGPTANTRPLKVVVGNGRAGIKICDPKVSAATDARFCPP